MRDRRNDRWLWLSFFRERSVARFRTLHRNAAPHAGESSEKAVRQFRHPAGVISHARESRASGYEHCVKHPGRLRVSSSSMKKLVLKMSVSVDGFVGGPKGELDWIFRTQSKDAVKWEVAMLSNASLHLMGSRTYHDMAAWWPTSKEPFAPAMNEIPKAVFSRRGVGQPDKKLTTGALKSARTANRGTRGANASAQVWESWLHPLICIGKLATQIRRLKNGTGKPLLAHGGAGFARSLIETGLIDEYHLLVHPVALGKGLPIFRDVGRPLDLILVDSTPFRSGAVAQIYRPKTKRA